MVSPAFWNDDPYRPANPTDLSAYDNYEIYDIVITRVRHDTKSYKYYSALQQIGYRNNSARIISSSTVPAADTQDINTFKANPLMDSSYVYDSFSTPKQYILYEGFYPYANELTPERTILINQTTTNDSIRTYAVQRWTPRGAAYTEIIYNLFDEFPYIENEAKIIWESLILNGRIKFSGIATTTGTFKFNYWGINPLENHPKINKTLDYWEKEVMLKKGSAFSFELYYPVAHTLRIPDDLLIAINNQGFPPLGDILSSNRIYANSLPNRIVNNPPPSFQPKLWIGYSRNYIDQLRSYYYFYTDANGDTQQATGYYVVPSAYWEAPNNPQLEYDYSTFETTWLGYYVMRATNQVQDSTWGVTLAPGGITESVSDIFKWHFEPRDNMNQYGNVIMDSIRTILTSEAVELLKKALDAENFATNHLDDTKDRVTNLGYLVENIARVLGLRFDDNGNINFEEEKAQFLPATLNNPDSEPDANGKKNGYNLTSFGHRGRYVPYLPTTYNPENKEEILHDVVHDLPQMLEAILRQMDKSLGIQHGSEIRINGLDGKVQSYPNQLSLLLHLSRQIEEIKFSTAKMLNVGVVTSAEVRELFSGIGIPATNKFLTLQDTITGHEVQLPYFGHQKNQLSILKELSTIKINLAVQNGMMLPKKSNPLFDPFKRFK
jgi:hypothetical protein